MSDRKWFTAREVAEHFNVTPQTVWLWIKAGKLKAYKINSKHYRINASDIVKFMEKTNEKRSNY